MAVGWGTDDRGRVDARVKRTVDVVAAASLLTLLVPVLLLVAASVAVESRGGVLYRCPRVGRGGRVFAMLKFRKMRADAAGPDLTAADDERFTRIGRFLAASKLDELPQLWNVLKGEMSLVGPRPESESFVAKHLVEYAEILSVTPGITGLSQLAFARESEILDPRRRVEDYVTRVLPQKLALDRLYVVRGSVALDLRILCWTIVVVLLRRPVAVHRGDGKMNVRRRRAAFASVPR